MDITAPTVSGEDGETDRFVLWAGALLHAPHRAVRQQAKTLHSLVYISARSRGSPAYQFGLLNTMYITHLNGIATPGTPSRILLLTLDLDAFLGVALAIPDNTYARVKVVSFDNQPLVLAVKTNMHYFPTLEMIKDPSCEGGWRRGIEKEENGPAHPGIHVGVSEDLISADMD
jgi:pro-apoptotic serine protease NMA111